MRQQNTIKQCVLICQSLTSDYQTSNVFNKLGSTPVIDLCVNWLIDNGIRQIHMFCSKSKDSVSEYVQNFTNNTHNSNIALHYCYMKNQQMKNFGDVMRQVQFRNKISQDFLILYADTVTNINLTKAISGHFKKKAQLKSVVLTSIIRDNSFDNKIHITNPQTGQILQMDEDTSSNKFILNSQRINLKKMNVEIRRDLTHCDVYICTVDVFKSFKQTYEYTTMFDFINGMLTSQVYEEKIIGHILDKNQQCYRINKSKDYYLAYVNYLSNHFYPYTLNSRGPTANSCKGRFVTKNFNKIIFNNVRVPKCAYISNNCYVGESSNLGDDVQIQKSIITNSCQVSKQSSLKNCLILQGCSITQKSKFQNCLIQKVNQTQQIRRFTIFPKYESELISEPLFQQTPPPEQNTFQQQLQQILAEDPQIQIVSQLNSIRFHHNRTLPQFTKQMIRLLNPQGVKGVESLAKNWGQILLKLNDKQNILIDSLYYSCANIPAYEKAFHVFLQFFYQQDLLKDFSLINWYEQAIKKHPNSAAIQKCENFIMKLKQQSSEDEEADSQQGSGSNPSNNSDNNQKSSDEQNK